MAFNSFFRRASSSIIHLPIRSTGSQRTYHGVITPLEVAKGSRISVTYQQYFLPFLRFFSTDQDSTTKKASEEYPTAKFPFLIEDGSSKRSITLTRKFQDEIIKINNLKAYQNVMDYREEDRSMAGDEEFYDYNKELVLHDKSTANDGECLCMDVKIFHGDIHRMRLKFDVLASFDHPAPRIVIRRMFTSVDPRRTDEFSELHLVDFEDFLKKRGITPNNRTFLLNHLKSRGAFDIDRVYDEVQAEKVQLGTKQGADEDELEYLEFSDRTVFEFLCLLFLCFSVWFLCSSSFLCFSCFFLCALFTLSFIPFFVFYLFFCHYLRRNPNFMNRRDL